MGQIPSKRRLAESSVCIVALSNHLSLVFRPWINHLFDVLYEVRVLHVGLQTSVRANMAVFEQVLLVDASDEMLVANSQWL
jgi:hypothetical protein